MFWQGDCIHGMLSTIDATAAAEAAQLLEGELAARELLQGIVDKLSGASHVFSAIADLVNQSLNVVIPH